ncbi:cupin domain-containing protein [Gracilimonas mengyeensis]|uniref:Mannose-6-phosphate isomerase, cupin superfamily n=1 Tax=Gracilimonas mengyeensis TaxID=1302730 RepID=A0A521AUB3_9BACT|nr:cupin domain-containing protein [Gracilimonas mengyeensis]SMO38200.1 Mannose-6-phosphate isomerase, cupin superfamily [Gracilimonas mengyeensis]
MTDKANLLAKFEQIQEYWTPKIIAETNGQLVKLAKLRGEFIWHNHENEDELFYVVKGELLLRFKDREIQLTEGDLYVVPAGEDHLPIAPEECWVMLVEPAATKHTGDVSDERTVDVDDQEWI